MTVSTKKKALKAEYRYFVCDAVSNDVLAELPFQNVSYGRGLREAGRFSGQIPVTGETYNLDPYTNTMPGKTALYIVRNGVCVWGGLIWSRQYDIKEKMLTVNGSEYTSYLYHRTAWKTWANEYESTVRVESGTGYATLETEHFDFVAGYPVHIDFGTDATNKYDGTYYVLADPAPTTNSFAFRGENGDYLPVSDLEVKENASTVTVRQDTYEFTRDFLKALAVDFYDLRYDNTEIEPAAQFAQTISFVSRSSNVATVVTPEAHGFILGQRITITNSKIAGFDGRWVITEIPSSTTIKFANTGSNVAQTAVNPVKRPVTSFSRKDFVATIATSSAHGYDVGDTVVIEGVNGGIDGTFIITTVPDSTSFTYDSALHSTISTSTSNYGYVVRTPEVRFSTYGEFSKNSALNLDYSTQELSEQAPRVNAPFRGSDLSFVGELLEEYSNISGGFEYRIDCTYDEPTNAFKRQFVFLPLQPDVFREYLNTLQNSKLQAGHWAPVSAFDADSIVFEYPGNVLGAEMEESAEDAATRFWVQGDDATDVEGAALPFAGNSAIDFLEAGWPILDQVEKVDGITEEDTLFDYATRYLNEARPPLAAFTITVDGSVTPAIGSYKPGDWCSVIIDDHFVQLRLESGLENGSESAERDGLLLRKIDSYEVKVTDGSVVPEEVTITLVSESAVDAPGEDLFELTVLSIGTTTTSLSVVVDVLATEPISVALLRGTTTLTSWTVNPETIFSTTYNATGLTAGTEYTFYLSGPSGLLDSITFTTTAA